MIEIKTPDDIKQFNECYIWEIKPKEGGFILIVEHPEDHNKYEIPFTGGALIRTKEQVFPAFHPIEMHYEDESIKIQPIVTIASTLIGQ